MKYYLSDSKDDLIFACLELTVSRLPDGVKIELGEENSITLTDQAICVLAQAIFEKTPPGFPRPVTTAKPPVS